MLYFEIGRKRFTRSRCWWLSLCMPGGGRLAGDGHQRGVVHVGVGHAGDQIRGPRPQRRQADSRPAGQPAVDVGHEGGRLFVAGGNEADGAVRAGHRESRRSLRPGSPKMTSTPSFSRQRTNSSATFIMGERLLPICRRAVKCKFVGGVKRTGPAPVLGSSPTKAATFC